MAPPAEIAAHAKAAVGTWRCKGDEWDDKGGKTPLSGTTKIALGVDGWWITETSEIKGRMPFKMQMFASYDATARKWRRVGVMSGGVQFVGTADPAKDGKMTWSQDMLGPQGAAMFRDVVDASDPKAGLRMSGTLSMDRGKTWLPVYEMTCRK